MTHSLRTTAELMPRAGRYRRLRRRNVVSGHLCCRSSAAVIVAAAETAFGDIVAVLPHAT